MANRDIKLENTLLQVSESGSAVVRLPFWGEVGRVGMGWGMDAVRLAKGWELRYQEAAAPQHSHTPSRAVSCPVLAHVTENRSQQSAVH